MSAFVRPFRAAAATTLALLLLPFSVAQADLIDVDVQDMIAFPELVPVKGVSTLTRREHGVDVLISTSGLESMGAYTLWWVVFNNPAACDTPFMCGLVESDFEDPAVDVSVLWGAGFLSDMDGFATFWAQLGENEPPLVVDLGNPNGLLDSVVAEIHVVLRVHTNDGEPVQPGQVAEWVGSFNGGCPDGVGCADVQFAVHKSLIPVPAAFWLFASALGLLGWARYRLV
ncbi:MAG: hypothetical protein QNJ73_10760 [Gammaproteobacteria bacterium]|nr:hypothetical protein [Gammaproteobacteria bacterium]